MVSAMFGYYILLTMKKVLMLMMVLLVSVTLEAQERLVRGLISDSETGEPLIGATIEMVGTAIGTVTDERGRFQLSVTSGKSIKISYVGYESQTIDNPEQQLSISLISSYQLEQLIIKGVRASGKDPITRTDVSK